jgi:polyhydroxyalkanoate synthesis regulator phasin
MNLNELEHQLLMCISSHDPEVQSAANLTGQYTQMMKNGEISNEEYTEVLLDIQRSLVIQENMAELEAKERLNVAINGLISLARLV